MAYWSCFLSPDCSLGFERLQMRSLMRSALLLAFVVFGLTGCFGVYYPGACHDNFIRAQKDQVGRSIKDPGAHLVRYSSSYTEYQNLPNGNVEYGESKDSLCRVFFEVDPKSETIIGWRYEGAVEYCKMCP